MVFGNGVKNIQTAAYNGARTVLICFCLSDSRFLRVAALAIWHQLKLK